MVACAVVLSSCSKDGEGAERCGPASGVVEVVIDGDTLQLESGEKVRYLLVDTPETSGAEAECYGAESFAYNRSLVEGRAVTLAYDEPCEDRFGRLLAYVSVEGREVNRLLIERGFGCVLYIPPSGSARREELEALEAEARAAGKGLWGFCAGKKDAAGCVGE